MVRLRTDGSDRWRVGAEAISETGNNSGSNFQILRYSNTGSYVGEGLTIYRNSGQVRVHNDMRLDGELNHRGIRVGFFNTGAVSRPAVTGSRSDGSAWGSLLDALVKLGLVTDPTTA